MVDVPSKGYQPIENYGIIGDLYTVALVGMDGSIDLMAFPHFDSPTVFAALLDWQKGGRFQIAPRLLEARQKQLYLPDSNILLTRFLASDGVAEISDCMPVPVQEDSSRLPHCLQRDGMSPWGFLGNVKPPNPGVAEGERSPVVKGKWKPHLQSARIALRRHQET